jgi:hypothetical protein
LDKAVRLQGTNFLNLANKIWAVKPIPFLYRKIDGKRLYYQQVSGPGI